MKKQNGFLDIIILLVVAVIGLIFMLRLTGNCEEKVKITEYLSTSGSDRLFSNKVNTYMTSSGKIKQTSATLDIGQEVCSY